MRLLKIQLKNGKTDEILESLVCGKLDATLNITVLSESVMIGKKNMPRDYHYPYQIDHWNIVEGMITIYYENGLVMEVTRIYFNNEPEVVKLTIQHCY